MGLIRPLSRSHTNALGIAGRRELNCRRVASNPDANDPDDPNSPDPDNPDPHPYA